jgi:hypothetical protein
MAGHTSEKRWRRNQNTVFGNSGVSEQARDLCQNMVATLTTSRAAFLELQELYIYVGSTVQLLADQLFFEDWSTRLVDPQVPDVYETEANAVELAKAQDLFDAITALNELHQCADNVAVPAEDRYAQLRRMS